MSFFRSLQDDAKLKSSDKVRIVLDIDDTIASPVNEFCALLKDQKSAKEQRKYPLLRWFFENDMIIYLPEKQGSKEMGIVARITRIAILAVKLRLKIPKHV